MQKILGMPRNAAIVIGGIALTAIALAIGLLIPRGNTGAPDSNTPQAGPASLLPQVPPNSPTIQTPITTATALPQAPAGILLDTSKEPTMAGLKPTLINFDFDNLRSVDAIAAFSAQSSMAIIAAIPPGQGAPMTPPISIHLQNAPLYQGLFELLRGTGTVVNELSPASARLTFPASQVMVSATNREIIGRWCLSGPFAMVISRIDHTRDLVSETSDIPVTIYCSLYAEPALTIAQFPTTFAIEQCTDEKNQPINCEVTATGTPARIVPRAGFTIALHPARPAGQKIASLRARAPFNVAIKTERIGTTDPAETLNKTIGDLGVRAEPITLKGASYTLDIRFSRENMAAAQFEKFRAGLATTTPTFFGPTGNRVTSVPSVSIRTESPDAIIMHMALPAPVGGAGAGPAANPPHHFSLDIPLETREVSVPFEFHDLILP